MTVSDVDVCLPGTNTQYSPWFPVPEDRSTWVEEIVEGRKFQIRTEKEIDSGNNIRWNIMGGVGWFTFDKANEVGARNCKGLDRFCTLILFTLKHFCDDFKL